MFIAVPFSFFWHAVIQIPLSLHPDEPVLHESEARQASSRSCLHFAL